LRLEKHLASVLRMWHNRSMKTAVVHARIEPQTKQKAEGVLRKLGLTPTEAIRIFYKQISIRGGLPFQVAIPNKLTATTLEKSRRGEDIEEFESLGAMFKNWEKWRRSRRPSSFPGMSSACGEGERTYASCRKLSNFWLRTLHFHRTTETIHSPDRGSHRVIATLKPTGSWFTPQIKPLFDLNGPARTATFSRNEIVQQVAQTGSANAPRVSFSLSSLMSLWGKVIEGCP